MKRAWLTWSGVLALAAVAAVGSCSKTNLCKQGTVLVTVNLDAVTSGADKIEADVVVDGVAAPSKPQLAHASSDSTGSIELDFPRGYQVGKSVTVTLVALDKNGAALGSKTGMISLPAAGCGNLTIDLDSGNAGAGGTGGGGVGGGGSGGVGGSGSGGAAGGNTGGAGGSGASGSGGGGAAGSTATPCTLGSSKIDNCVLL